MLVAAASGVRRFSMAAVTAACRLEASFLLRMLALEGLHLIRVLTLELLLSCCMLGLGYLAIGGLLAHQLLRFILMTLQQRC